MKAVCATLTNGWLTIHLEKVFTNYQYTTTWITFSLTVLITETNNYNIVITTIPCPLTVEEQGHL